MDQNCIQILDHKNHKTRINSRYWLLLSDGCRTKIGLLKPRLNYLINTKILNKFAIISAQLSEVHPIGIKKVLYNLYNLPMPQNMQPLFFVDDIVIKVPGHQVGQRILPTLKRIAILKIVTILKDSRKIDELEIPLTLVSDIKKMIA